MIARTVWIRTPARLHLGMLDLSGSLGRRFGGLGLAVERPSVVVSVTAASSLEVIGPCAARVQRLVARVWTRLDSKNALAGARIRIHETIPSHVGLGSGTQLHLAVVEALARLRGIPLTPEQLTRLSERGRRSGVGTWVYLYGGFVVEGGRPVDGARPLAPLLIRLDIPAAWRWIVAIPRDIHGIHGRMEEEVFLRRIRMDETVSGQICRRVIMQMLPALVEGDIRAFGTALTEVQRLVGDVFAPVQGGRFAHPLSAALIDAMLELGAAGAGQSSWGPTVYGVVADASTAQRLAESLQHRTGPDGRPFGETATIMVVATNRAGRQIWTER